jgi:hypothetical protein
MCVFVLSLFGIGRMAGGDMINGVKHALNAGTRLLHDGKGAEALELLKLADELEETEGGTDADNVVSRINNLLH